MVTESVPVSQPGAAQLLGNASKHVIGKDYFATTGVAILSGRAFRRDDETAQTAAVVVSAALAAEFFPGQDPINRRLMIGKNDPTPARALPGSYDYRGLAPRPLISVVVVGVAGDVAEGLVIGKSRPVIYFPLRAADYAQPGPEGLTLIVRAVPGVDVLAQVRREIAALDPDVTTFHAISMQGHIEEFTSVMRVASWTYGMIGFFGYVLAGVGLAGVTAYAVQQRRREIGIRMALGARARNVLGIIMKEGTVLVAIVP